MLGGDQPVVVLMSRRGLLLFAAMCVIWGIPYLFIRVAVGELSPVVLVFVRTGIAALILLPIALAGGGLRPALRRWRPLVAFAMVEVAAPWWLLASAEQQISSSLAGLLISAVPLVATAMAPVFGNRERSGRAAIVGLVLGFVGVAVIVGFDIRGARPLAIGEMGLVVVGYALGPAIASRYLSDLPGLNVSAFALAITVVAYLPFALFQLPNALPSGGVIGSVLVLAVACTAVAFLVFFALIREIGPVRSTVITYINPAVAAILGVVVLKEAFSVGMAAGFALVIAGSVLATRRRPGVHDAPAARAGVAAEHGG
jgi:drug/metabolite transporter (DMT)-like permease